MSLYDTYYGVNALISILSKFQLSQNVWHLYVYILYWHKSDLMKCFSELAKKKTKKETLTKNLGGFSLNAGC